MATSKPKEIFGVSLESSALAFSTQGVAPDKWLQNIAGDLWTGVKKATASVVDLGKRIVEGGKEMLSAIARGEFQLFKDWLRDDPVSAIAGGIAVVLTVAVTGWFIGGVASAVTAVVSGGIAAMWATLGAVSIGGLTLSALLPSLQQVIVGGGSTLMNLDWMKSDKAILAELNGAYLGFLNNVGESVGRMIVAIALGGAKSNPKLTLNISAAAAFSITKEIEDGDDISDELIDAMADIANIFIRYARNLAGKLGYLELRKWARTNVKIGNKWIDRKNENWGLIEGQSFVISSVIDEKIEKITEENPPFGNILEGLKDGMSEGFSDMIVFK
ncbi:MAG: hypothetical protein WBL95_21150 [Microcoleus sp.]